MLVDFLYLFIILENEVGLAGEESDGLRRGEDSLRIVGLLELIKKGLLILKESLMFSLELVGGLAGEVF